MKLTYLSKTTAEIPINIENNCFLLLGSKYKILHLDNGKIIAHNKTFNNIEYFFIFGDIIVNTDSSFTKHKLYNGYENPIYKLKNIPEYSLVYKNDLFLINHRCASSALRSAILQLSGKIELDSYIEKDDKSVYGWGLNFNTYLQTLDLIKSNKYKIFMFFRDPINYFISQYNAWQNYSNIDDFINKIKHQNNLPPLEHNSHSICQIDMLTSINLELKDVNLINVIHIEDFFKQRYNFNYIPKHITKDSNKKINRNELTDEQIKTISDLYKNDFLLYDFECKNYLI